MDYEQRQKRQSLRVIISESIMVLTVVIMVAVLAFVVSGYWVGSGFKVERQGMLQVNSIPTGATVAVDGETAWFQRTNTSKVLSSGEHEIVLTKDGYDSWSKTVQIGEGLLYRLHYPRLFLQNREKSTVYDATSTTFAAVSRDHKHLLLANNTTTWTLLDLGSNNLDPKTLDIAKIFSSVSIADGAKEGLFTGTITSVKWSGDNAHVLISASSDGTTEWVLIDIRDLKNSINLTREFAATFLEMRIFDNSANTLLAVRSGNLHKIDVGARQVSAVLVENINNYDFYGQDIIFVSNKYLGILKNANDLDILVDFTKTTTDSAVSETTDSQVITAKPTSRAYLSRFYDDKYVTVVTGDHLALYRYDDKSEVLAFDIGFTPETIELGMYGDYVFMNSGLNVETLDMESHIISDWTLGSTSYGWLESNLLYNVADGALSVYDYDGLNHRSLATGVSSRFPVVITDDKWLYYFSNDNLIREVIN